MFTLDQPGRERVLLPKVSDLIESHRERCPPYRRILDAIGGKTGEIGTVADLPWLPVRLFRDHWLASVPESEVIRIAVSSGTTGTEPSRIALDAKAATAQQRVVAATLGKVLGGARLPMLLVESQRALNRDSVVSARSAGTLGLLSLGRDHTMLLDENGTPDITVLTEFLRRNGDRPFVIFGFTFMVWIHLYEMARRERLDLSQGVLLHSGGWKRMTDRAVTNEQFRRRFAADTGLRRIHNYYGMVEQLGTLHLEGPGGNGLYSPDFADVIVRDPRSWAVQPVGRPGVIEVVSTLPTSYPGNVLLTEDLGVVHGVDDGDWPGKRFSVLGRLPRARARGCSDTMPASG